MRLRIALAAVAALAAPGLAEAKDCDRACLTKALDTAEVAAAQAAMAAAAEAAKKSAEAASKKKAA